MDDWYKTYRVRFFERNGMFPHWPVSMEDREASSEDFYANLTWEQAREHLASFTVEEVRQLLENGAFGERMTEDLKTYLAQRIIDPDFR